MATNATNTEDAVDDSKPVTEDDLREDFAKAEVESAKAEDETAEAEPKSESEETSEEDGQTDDQADGEAQAEPTFVKQVPSIAGDTEEDYRKNLEVAYQQSTAEALRLKGLADAAADDTPPENTEPVDPRLLYLDRLLNKDIQTTFAEFKKSYPQVDDPAEYARFENEAASLSRYYQTQNQVLTADELYPKVAAILGWQSGESKDKLNMALKDKAAVSKTTSATTTKPKSKISEDIMAWNRQAYPNKTDEEIRKELEPYLK